MSLDAGEPIAVAFRENYTPTASGTRPAGERQYHALTFNLGSDDITGTADVGIDRLYAGTTAPEGVTFPSVTPRYTVSLIQPSAGSVSLQPAGREFDEGTERHGDRHARRRLRLLRLDRRRRTPPRPRSRSPSTATSPSARSSAPTR